MGAGTGLELRLLGGFETRIGGQVVSSAVWRQRRAAAVVKLLALEPGHRLHREQLLETLWPDLDIESAANNLRGALHHARSGLEQAGALPGTFLTRDGDTVLLGPPDAVEVDVETFTQEVNRAWQSADPEVAARAAELYAGDLLPNDPYEDWAAARREGLRVSYLTLLTRLAGLHEELGELAQAIAICERILLTDPLDEAAHARLMRLHTRMGHPQLALAQFSQLQSLLDRELGTVPEPATQALAAAIREARFEPVMAAPQPAATQSKPLAVLIAPGAQLPAPVDELLGRERECAELERLLGTARLITLTGAGGIGKTRLAQEAARASRAQFPDGVAFIDLAPLSNATLVLPTIARAIGVDETNSRSTSDLLAATIGERRLLLVLDNFEHLTTAGPEISTLLEACPRLTMMATSRMRLRLRSEHEYPVMPLALPERPVMASGDGLAQVSQTAAIALFARRAVAARPGFSLTAQNIELVEAICRRLDGLPLAIELAAPQVRMLAPAQLLQRLERPLDVLGTMAQDVPSRQRTLRTTIAWSYDLLAPQEQLLFRRLSVFAGGWPLEATEAMASINGEATAIDAVETLSRLIDQNLIQTRQAPDDAELRYVMLETIREFAVEQLAAGDEERPVRERHAAWVTDFTLEASRGLFGPDEIQWLDRLDLEHDNIRAALSWLIRNENMARVRAITSSIWWFWATRGYGRETLFWIEKALSGE
jgi:predicted ATPase/DNA-binding SARP family transcriptional activator